MKHKPAKFVLIYGAILSLIFPHIALSEGLQSFENCTVVPMRGADGDSFMVNFPDGKQRVVRLYAVDCIEAKIWDETDSRRLREQRRYFGISNCRKTQEDSIREAKRFGQLGYFETMALLSKPFTVHTSFADGRGSGYQKRIYAFITTSTGKDLGSHLVSQGLARAFGVCRETPGGVSRDELRSQLEDLELTAAKLARGAWSMTNWSTFAMERSTQRLEEAELALAIDRADLTKIVDPNTAPRDELMTLSGIGETLALRIIESRPYSSAEDLLKVKGFGEKTLERLKKRLPKQFQELKQIEKTVVHSKIGQGN